MLTTNFVMAQEQEVKQKFDCLIGYFGSPQEPIINGQSFCPGTVLNFSSCDEGGFNNANLPADVRCIQGKVGTYTIVATHQTTGVVTSAITTFTLPIAQSGASIPVAQLILTEPGCYSIQPFWSYVSQCDPLIVKTISQGLNNNAPTTVCITAPANALPPIITRETPNPICANSEVCFLTDRPESGTIRFSSPGVVYNFNDPNLTTNFVSYNTSGQEITRICYTYPTPGNYQVSRTNFGTCGGSNQSSSINVNVVENNLSIKHSLETDCNGFVSFGPSLQCPTQVPSVFSWNFGDGTTGVSYSNVNGGLITHQYTDPNLTTATVTVSANGGAPYTYIVNVITEPNINLQAAYSDVTKACSPQETYTLTGVPAGFTVNWTISGGNFTTPNNQATIGVNWTATENDPVAGPFIEGGSISVTLKNGSCEYTKTFDIGTCCATNQAGYININDKSGTKYTSQVPSMQAGTANNLKYYIDGELVIDNSLTLNNCVIKMGPYARILVKEPYVLTLNITTISAGCDYMWEEILIDKGAVLNVQNGTRIEDGIVAINSVSGSEFHISNSFMNKNRTAIYVEGKQDNQNPSNITGTNIGYAASGSDPYNLFATGITYTSVGLRKPYNNSTSRVGIVLNFVDDITIGNPTTGPGNPQGLDNRNVFYQLMYGIESSYSNLNVYNNKFDKINFDKLEGTAINVKGTTKPLEKQSFLLNVGANPNGYKNVFVDCDNGVKTIYNVNSSIRGNKFEEVYKAISISNNTQGNSVSIRNNIISDANWGIYCYMNTTCNTQILNNNINFTSGLPPNYMEYGIYVNENLAKAAAYTIKGNNITDAQYGIYLNSCFFPKVESNDVKLNYSYFIASNLKQETAGVTVKNCSGAYINCNTVSDFANNGYEQSTIRNNLLYASKGVLCVASPNSEIYDNNISKVVAGVDFNNTCTATKVYTNDFDRIRTGLLLQSAAIIGTQGFIPPVANNCNKLIAADNTFTNKATNRIVTYGPSMTPPIVAQSIYYYRPAANQTVSNAVNPSYNVFSNGADFLPTQQVASCRNDFGCVRRAGPINDGLILSEKLAKNQVPFADNDNKRKWIARAQVYQQVLNNDTLVLQSTVLQQFKDSVDLSTLPALNNARTATNDSARNYQSISNALAVNNALASNELAEQLYQQVNNIRATALLADTLFNTAQQDSLRAIALLCPYTDGFAVFEARALLSYYDSVGTQYTNTCELAQAPQANRSAYNDLSELINNENTTQDNLGQAQTNTIISPNPSKGSLTVELLNTKKPEISIIEIVIYDIYGRQIKSYQVNTENKRIEIEKTGLSKGLYFVQTKLNNSEQHTHKWIITEE